MTAERLRVVLVTGLSGGGKSSVLRELEDLGYEAVDNPPLHMIEEMVTRGVRKLAIGVDARTRGFDASLARSRSNACSTRLASKPRVRASTPMANLCPLRLTISSSIGNGGLSTAS